MKLNTSEIDWKLTFGSFGFVLLLGILAVVYPDAVKSSMGSMLDFTVINFGSGFLWYTIFATGALLFLAFSKYGDIRMGDSKPKFTKFQLFAMALSAGMGASTMYWGFIEAVYYFMDPQFGITDKAMAMEYASAYNMFHWGAAGWFIYLIVAIPFAVVFYLKGSRRMSLSGVINALFNDRLPGWAQKFIDLLFIITTLAATALTLGLGIPMISSNLASLTGIPDNLMLGIGVILGLSVIFSMSSYIGIEKGMARLSSATIYICAAFVGIIFIIGPSALIMNNLTNGIGVMLSEYIRMSTNTDPYGTTLFPQYWTVFFLANWISYSPGVGVFITKIIQGQKLRDVILILVIGGTMGSAVIFGVCGTFSMDLVNTGVIDGVKLIGEGQPTELVKQIFNSTSIPMVLTAIYLVTMILFTVTTLDGTSYSLAGIATKQLDDEANVNPMFRLFWCLLLTALPIIFLLINADLNILKAFPVLIIVLIVPVFFVAAVKTLQYLKLNYNSIMAHQLEQDKLLGLETEQETEAETATQKPAIQA